MDKLDILMAIFGTGFAIIIGLFGFIWSELKDMRIKMDRMGENSNHLSERVARIEGMLMSKESCLLKSDDRIKKAE